MKIDVKKLSLGDVVLHRRGSFALWLIHFIFGTGISVFFKKIELYNSENLPEKSGIIFVSNHPNALIDPALLFIALPRNIAFLAKSTLFKMPVIGYLVRTVGALPLYRQKDEGADVSKNQETFRVARELLKKGGAIAIFPEGVSHNEPQLQPLKTGAARIALGAVSAGKNPASLKSPNCSGRDFLYGKNDFSERGFTAFRRSVSVLPVALDEDGHPPREIVRELTAKIENALREVTLNAGSEAQINAARIAGDVFTSTTPHEENLAERLDFLRKFVAEPAGENDEKLEKQLADYEKNLARLGIGSEFLALAGYSKSFVLKHALIRSWYLILLAPLAISGAILHFPAYQLVKFLASRQTKKGDFDMASTVKLLAALVFIPLTWIILAVILEFYFGWFVALISIPLAALGGYAALKTIEEIEDLSGWLKAISAFFLKRDKFLRLLAERKNLFQKVKR